MTIEKLKDFSESDVQEFEHLIVQLEGTGKDADSFAKECRIWFYNGEIFPNEKVRLTNWCKPSTDPRKLGREIAQKISILVFGKIITEFD